MNAELQNLIDDPRFLKYHAETVKGKRFNPFDVLRYSDYEIRHSNVLAWLLQPNETHGIGDAFLRDFMTALNDGARSQGIPPVPLPSSFEAQDVVVERESYDVDITLSLRNERVVIAIENKVGEASPEHASQVMAYEERLREQRGGTYDVLQSVLLTTSPMVDVSERRFIHVSWARVHDIVQSIQATRGFDFDEGERVRAFLGHYLEIVERMAVQPGVDRHYFTTLLEDHRPILIELLEEREQGVDGADEGMPDGFGAYSETLDRLVSDFRQEPRRLRSAVRTFLEHKGFWTSMQTSTAYSTYYLYFWNSSMEETRKSLDLPWQPRWLIIFHHREVLLQLQLDPSSEEAARPVVDRIMRFMKENPIDAFSERKNRYPMDVPWTGCLMVYKHPPPNDRRRTINNSCGRDPGRDAPQDGRVSRAGLQEDRDLPEVSGLRSRSSGVADLSIGCSTTSASCHPCPSRHQRPCLVRGPAVKRLEVALRCSHFIKRGRGETHSEVEVRGYLPLNQLA